MQSTTHTVTVRWNGTDRTLLVEPTVNVRDTFGAAAFLVAEPSQSVVSLDPAGRPLAPLEAATTPRLHRRVRWEKRQGGRCRRRPVADTAASFDDVVSLLHE